MKSLLNVSKLDYIAIDDIEKEEFDLVHILEEIIEKFKWQNTELNWVVNYHNKPRNIDADLEKIIVALENIFDNQIRYAEKLIKVEVISGDEIVFNIDDEDTNEIDSKMNKELGEESIFIKIFNDGSPISKETMENLFSRFNKGDEGEFGLGLAFVKTIIDRHDGEIWVDNENEGISF